jgi:hypothetical protein
MTAIPQKIEPPQKQYEEPLDDKSAEEAIAEAEEAMEILEPKIDGKRWVDRQAARGGWQEH